MSISEGTKKYIKRSSERRSETRKESTRGGMGQKGNNAEKGHNFCQGICSCLDDEQSRGSWTMCTTERVEKKCEQLWGASWELLHSSAG